MALFNTPSLLGHIFQKETFPEGESGITGLMSGIGSGLGTASQYKSDVKKWNELPDDVKAKTPKPSKTAAWFGYGDYAQGASGPGFLGGVGASQQPMGQPGQTPVAASPASPDVPETPLGMLIKGTTMGFSTLMRSLGFGG
jgi:hypothetical protein